MGAECVYLTCLRFCPCLRESLWEPLRISSDRKRGDPIQIPWLLQGSDALLGMTLTVLATCIKIGASRPYFLVNRWLTVSCF